MKTWWHQGAKPGNLGDVLTPKILAKLGIDFIRCDDKSESNKLIAIGSTARFIKPGDVVWGTGIMFKNDVLEKDATYLAVRGPLTGKKAGCTIYGDPGLLCSKLFPFQVIKRNPVGVVPHYIDQDFNHPPFPKIDVRNNNPLQVIKQIVQCESIISSSLHGIIIAHSYGIPAGWWKPSDRLSGDDSKFEDYALSVDIDLNPSDNYMNVEMTLPAKEKVEEIQRNLIDAISSFNWEC